MKLNFNKYPDGLIPAIIQDADTKTVLMLGFMNEEALFKTKAEAKVTFYSRTKQRLWTKGEVSGNFLYVKEIIADCDQDTLLIKVSPAGPTCHTGKDTCFSEENKDNFLFYLEKFIKNRKLNPEKNSYTNKLFNSGVNRIAKKLGEEAVELVIEAKDNNDELFVNEAADLIYHFLVLLAEKNILLNQVISELARRHEKK